MVDAGIQWEDPNKRVTDESECEGEMESDENEMVKQQTDSESSTSNVTNIKCAIMFETK